MFHWICPECGREIPPAVKECAACDPSSVEASVVVAEPSKVEVAAGSLAAANGSEANGPAALKGAADPPRPPSLPEPLLRLAQKLREAGIGTAPAFALAPANAAALAAAPAPAPALEPPVSAPKPAAAAPEAPHPSSPLPPIVPAAQPQMLLLESSAAAIALLAPPELDPEPQPEPRPEPPPTLDLLNRPTPENLGTPAPDLSLFEIAPLEIVPSSETLSSDAPVNGRVHELPPTTPDPPAGYDLQPPAASPAPVEDPIQESVPTPDLAQQASSLAPVEDPIQERVPTPDLAQLASSPAPVEEPVPDRVPPPDLAQHASSPAPVEDPIQEPDPVAAALAPTPDLAQPVSSPAPIEEPVPDRVPTPDLAQHASSPAPVEDPIQEPDQVAAAPTPTHDLAQPAPSPTPVEEPIHEPDLAAAAPEPTLDLAQPAPSPTPAAAPEPTLDLAEPALSPAPVEEPIQEPDPVAAAPTPTPDLAQPAPSPAPVEEPIQEPDPAAAGRVPTPDLAQPAPRPAPPAPRLLEVAALELSPTPATPAAAAPPETFSHPALIAASSPALPSLVLAPLQDPTNLARRIRPASPRVQILRRDTGPRITLPGPALPAVLNSLQGAGLGRILVDRPRAPRKSAPGWLVTSLVAALLLAGILGLTLFNAPRSAADPSPTPSPVLTAGTEPNTTLPVSVPASPAISGAASYSLTKAIEVTGFRVVGDKKPEMRYLVVNHSAADLEPVTVYVTLRNSTAKPGQPPLYRFSFRAPTLAAFESKEMSAPVDKPGRSADWQNLHADIELGQ